VRDFSGSFSSRLDGMGTAMLTLQNETRASFQPVWERIDNICGDLNARREDIAATRTTLDSISSRIDACVERLDRQADGVRSLHGAYGRRETELDQIVEGLVRLRACQQPAMPEGL
jgi:ABC-type transporter Mla subunit MlaD